MSIILNRTVQHHLSYSLPTGGGGYDVFDILIPQSEIYDKTAITVYRDRNTSGARVIEEPRQGEFGNLMVKVRWWYDFNPTQDLVWYDIKVFSKPKAQIGEPGRIFLFEDINFEGRFREVLYGELDLTLNDGGYFNDRVSSVIITKGNWIFFKHINFNTPYMFNNRSIVLGPGMYPDVRLVGIENDQLSSLVSVTDAANHP